jgi:dihydroflavonol-4-reductase
LISKSRKIGYHNDNMKNKSVLILGSTGFIGGHIARKAAHLGWEVWGFRRDPNRVGYLAGYPIQWVQGDLMDSESLYKAMQGIEVVFHAAAFYPKSGNPREVPSQVEYAKKEIRNVIQAAIQAGVERIIYTSTLTTIGQPPSQDGRLADERDFYRVGSLSKSAYYESKIAMERLFLGACHDGLPGIVLNPTAVFGPGDVHLTMSELLIAVAKGWVLGWIPGEINIVDVRDVAHAHIAAAQKGQIGERYILGGHNLSIKDALDEAAQIIGVKPPHFRIPLWVPQALTLLADVFPMIPLPTNHLRALHLWQGYNTRKAEIELGFSPRPLRETLLDTYRWLNKQGLIQNPSI